MFTLAAPHTVASAASFAEWWRNSSRSQFTRVPFALTEDPARPGTFRYDNTAFFPIDGRLFGNEGRPHNYHFTVEIHAMFTYRGGEQFSITADDDSWLFINGRLVLDRGGVQGPVEGTVKLDELGLVRGQVYTFDLFHAERHTTVSTLRIVTNIALFLPWDPYDPNPPTATATVSGTRGNGDWYTSDATVTWATNDDEVPITSDPCAPATVSADTRGAILTRRVTAGAWTKVDSVVVKRDATAPVLTITQAKATYGTNEAIEIGCSASDATSGVLSGNCAPRRFEAGTLGAGSHVETFTATDAAGNVATATATLQVVAAGPARSR